MSSATEHTQVDQQVAEVELLHVKADDAVADGEVKEEVTEGDEKEVALMSKGDLASAILGVIQSILKGIEKDNNNRSEFTQNVCKTMRERYPSFNFVICHVKHSHKFDGPKGVDWDHWHEEFDINFGGTIGYEVYWCRSGTFTRHGDGGFLNWAYQGRVESRSGDGRTIVFTAP